MTDKISDLTFLSRDDFNREPIANQLIKLITSDIDISPMVIDGAWGSGKTEFCHKFINLLKDKESDRRIDSQIIYIDAFRADHADNPLMTILAELLHSQPNDSRAKAIFLKNAIPVLRATGKIVAKSAASWILRDSLDNVQSEITNTIIDANDAIIDHGIEQLLVDHAEAEKSIHTLQELLERMAKDKPILIFIDELDRCRPSYAVNMLETIKHIFDVAGVKFVLLANMNQIRASIHHCYGAAVDAKAYLDKFIKFSFVLPTNMDRTDPRSSHVSWRYFLDLAQQRDCFKPLISSRPVNKFIQQLVECKPLTLRETETLVRSVDIFQNLTNSAGFLGSWDWGTNILRFYGIYLWCFHPEIAEDMMHGRVDAKSLANTLARTKIAFFPDSHQHENLFDHIVAIAAHQAPHNPDGFQVNNEIRDWWRTQFECARFPSDTKDSIEEILYPVQVFRFNLPNF